MAGEMKHKQEDPGRGIECPKCGCHHFLVWYTRPLVGQIKRVRVCRHCGRKLITFERALRVSSDAPSPHLL
jgi:hypothetical protein